MPEQNKGQNQDENKHETRAKQGLLFAALLGLVIAGLAAAPSDRQGLSQDGTIARVNGRHIDRTDFASAYQALLADKSKAPTSQDKKLVLDRLIEEELLVQRGLEIGLLDGDASTRKAVAREVIAFALAQSGSQPIDDQTLRDYYGANTARFTPASRMQVQRIFVRQPDGKGAEGGKDAPEGGVTAHALTTRLDAIRNALRNGEDFTAVAARLSDPIEPTLPRIMLTRAKMIDYLGVQLTEAARHLPSGSISDALADGAGWHFLHIVRTQPASPPDFEKIRPQLLTALRRDHDDQALRNYLDWLRARANINLATDAPR